MVKNMSLWEKYLDTKKFPQLDKNLKVDTLIIGGGIAGLTTLYFLKDKKDVCLVEASQIGLGVTKNTTGKITYLQGVIYQDLEKNIDYKTAIKYLKSQKEGINLLKSIIKKEKINCDLELVKSYVVADKKADVKKVKQEKIFLESQGIVVKEIIKEDYYAIGVDDTYVFNVSKYLNGLKKVLQNQMIFENTKIENIKYQNGSYVCQAKGYVIEAKKVVVACHYPFFLFPFCLPLKSHIEKSYLIAWRVLENEKYSVITASNPGYSMRFYQDSKNVYKIGLARSHETAFSQDDKANFLSVQKLFKVKDEDIVYRWSNVDIISSDKMPFIGEIKDNLYIMTGFNTWGMINSVVGAKLISDLTLQKYNENAELFNPKRKNGYKVKSFFSNSCLSVISFVRSKLKNKKWYGNNIRFEKRKGENVAIYVDEQNNEHVVINKCPHMGCGLIFNEIEKTWDCPCHSSRFTIDGKCVKGPSLNDISFKE